MRNLIVFSFLSILFLVTSCSKEPILIPQSETEEVVKSRSTTIEIEVTETSNTKTGAELIVSFQANYDFSSAVLEPTQYLKFEDSNGNESTLTFQVNSFTGVSNTLSTTFAIGGNNLNGLSLVSVQEIIIDDEEIE